MLTLYHSLTSPVLCWTSFSMEKHYLFSPKTTLGDSGSMDMKLHWEGELTKTPNAHFIHPISDSILSQFTFGFWVKYIWNELTMAQLQNVNEFLPCWFEPLGFFSIAKAGQGSWVLWYADHAERNEAEIIKPRSQKNQPIELQHYPREFHVSMCSKFSRFFNKETFKMGM